MAPVDKAPSFMTLPAEIRLRIYVFVFAPSQNSLLKSYRKFFYHQRAPVHNCILRVNKQIYREALPEFHSSNTFHFIVDGRVQSGRIQIRATHEKHVKHLSIDMRTRFTPREDRMLATEMEVLGQQFTSLKTLTLHFILEIWSGDSAEYPRRGSGKNTAFALRGLLSTLSRMSIVVYGSPDNFAWWRESIAPEKNAWLQEQVVSSPDSMPTVYQPLNSSFNHPPPIILSSALFRYDGREAYVHTYKPDFLAQGQGGSEEQLEHGV